MGNNILACVLGILLLWNFPAKGEKPKKPTTREQAIATQLKKQAEQAWLGLKVYDVPDGTGCVVSWQYPGPLQGRFNVSPHMVRGDILLEVNGKPANVRELTRMVKNAKLGDKMTFKVMRTNPNINAAKAAPGSGKKIETFTITLASMDKWTGPDDLILPLAARPDLSKIVPMPKEATGLENFLNGPIETHKLRKPLDTLLAYFRKWLKDNYSANMLQRVAYGFDYPTRLIELQQLIVKPLSSLSAQPSNILMIGAENLDLSPPALGPAVDLSQPAAALQQAARRVRTATGHVERAFARLDPKARLALQKNLPSLVREVSGNKWIEFHEDPPRSVRAVKASLLIDHQALLDAMGALAGLMIRSKTPAPKTPTVKLPDALKDAVTGDVLAVLNVDGRWFVYGSFGANRYDMSKLDVVFDAGGNDTYVYPAFRFKGAAVIVDLAGNDRYEGQTPGPAGGWLGVSLLVDYVGNDRYLGGDGSCGTGVMGHGVLIDYNGADVYQGKVWAIGAGLYGMGALIDLGGRPDFYQAETMSQGIGGPRGFGLLFDAGGNDLYRANGPVPSNYNTPAVFRSYSQGYGFGIRAYDTGGIGVLRDEGGNDRYEAGEFSQGGGYYCGLGILHDRKGADLYYGNRYSQGSGCHQAFGVLVDDAGDDMYWTMTATSQGSSWDLSVGVLLDRAGNDAYRGDGVSQGAAAMQGFGWLIDLAGTDRYSAAGGSTHGKSGSNTYHYFHSGGALSFSLLLDAGGTVDVYSTGRPNGQTLSLGALNKKSPQHSPLHGLFIDTPKKTNPWKGP